MRSMTPRVLRRLLLIGGVAFAAWLFSGAWQAHAAAGDGLDPGVAAIDALPNAAAPAQLGAPAKLSAPAKTVVAHCHARGLVAVVARPHGVRDDGVGDDGIARRVIGTAVRVPSGDLVRRASALDPVLTLPTGRAGIGATWVPRHRTGAGSGDAAAAVRHGRPHQRVAHHDAARSAAAVVPVGTGRGGRAHARTAPSTPAPPAGLPCGAAGQTGAPPSTGSASAGGLAGHPARPAAAPQPSSVLTSVLGAVPPAVHTATDEPAVSPD